MAEYIDKDKFCHYLFKHIATFAENMIQMPVASTLQSVVNEIQEFQSEDVQPVKHGRWSGYLCSNCGVSKYNFISFNFDDQNGYARPFGTWLYCPRCGAKMDGET